MAVIIGNRKVIGFRNLVSDEALSSAPPDERNETTPVLDFSKKIPHNSESFSRKMT